MAWHYSVLACLTKYITLLNVGYLSKVIVYKCHLYVTSCNFTVTCNNYEISSLPTTPSDPLHMCLEYSNSSCSCKQMCVCVIACICSYVPPKSLLLQAMLQSKEHRLWHAFTIYQINGMPSCGLGPALRPSSVVFHWNNSRWTSSPL